ncbi:nucleoside deaminase [Legionella bononiensis]|uniref:Nucleoside deaminase n=1 Tax=Legionella bononiensis TaxID=2793102 RepID=A0ABS1WDK8_9GAMM|nr:nucleoside deaminase [Legionella bononiensis]MBL7481411.1 nucleoside deaminase [Legionella bononiensis]MBL7527443.1 nucleoside deaminase [Legionella bononiensis]
MQNYFELAIKEALQGVVNGEGAPFGACIVNQDQVIALAHDTVLKDNDATCHAEINAIRLASKKLGTYNLGTSAIYCTSEPCPMCLSAIHWSGIKKCYFIADRKCAAEYGFDDDFLYDELIKPVHQRKMSVKQELSHYHEVKHLFEYWKTTGLPIC